MATPEQIKAIAGLYVAYFDRAPDPAGLQFWVDQLDNGRDFATISQDFAISLEAKEIYPFLATPDVSSLGATNLVTSIYQNLFGRTPEAAGLHFWVNVVESGSVAVGDMVEAIMMGAQDTLVNGQLILDKTTVANKIECALEFVTGASNIPGFQFDAEAYSAARGAIDGVDATDESVEAAKFFTANYFGTAGNNRTDVHTLCEPDSIMLTPAEADQFVKQTVIYWGYNPHSHDETDGVDNLDGNDPNGNDNNLTNEGPEDGGVSAAEFFGSGGIFETIVGISLGDLASDGAINPNDDQPLYNFSMLEEINLEAVGDGTGVLHFAFADGTADDIVLTQEYFALVNDLFFDEEGNTRFFEKEIIAQLPVYVDANGNVTTTPQADQEPIGYVDAVLEGADATYEVGGPIILTPTANNGSTYERGFTSEVDDLIQAGRVELLHGAIIDGGLGSNTLEIDGKGYYAQPKKLDNIQHISVHDLPNVYSDGSASGGSSYPDLAETLINPNTIIDISRATDLETLTVTQGDFAGLGGSGGSTSNLAGVGNLTITGIRNGAETTLDGFFEAGTNVRLNYSSLSGDGLKLVFNNLNMQGDLEVSHNATKLNIESTGGSNFLAGGDFADDVDALEGQVREMVITGDAHLHIDGDMDATFANATPVIINASGNTGGVDLALTGSENVTFIGSSANDAFDVNTAQAADPTGQDTDFNNDQSVTIVGGAGNNNYQVETYTLTATNGDGNNNYEFEAVEANITLGDGDNHIEGNTVNFTAVAGDGDNRFDIEAYDSPQSSVWTYIDDLDTVVDITAGNGANVINVFANPLTLTAGGNLISGGNGHYLKPAQISIVAGDGGNTILIPALPFDLDSSDGVLSTVDVTTGDGNDDIFVGGSDITISSGGGNDTITLLGVDRDFAYDTLMLEDGNDPITATTNSQRADELVEGGALLNIDTGTGSARINLGNNESSAFDPSGQNGVIIAKDGSVITGENITLFVDTYANLVAADVTGVTSVILDDDSFNYTASPQANDIYSGDRAQLTITDEQFLAIGADNMRVDGATFNTHAFVKIVVTESTSLTALGVDDLPRNIDLYLEIQDGVTLTMTAEQLHTRVARDGVTLAQDGNTDLAAGRVIIEGGGINFDPFNTNDTVSTVIAGNVYYGGSLSDDFLVTNGSSSAWYNVQVKSVFGGYDRPADAVVEIAFTIDADATSEVGAFDTWHDNVEIVGNQDITFTGPIQLGLLQGENNNLFTVDFSALEGNANGLTLGNFEMVEAVYGNAGIGYDTEVFVEIEGNSLDNDPASVAALNAAQGVLDGLQAAADAAAADLLVAQTALGVAEANLAQEQDDLDAANLALAAAENILANATGLGVIAATIAVGIAQAAADAAQAAFDAAETAVTDAEAAVTTAEGDVAAADAAVDGQQAVVDTLASDIGSGLVGFENDNASSIDNDDRALISQGVLQYTVTVIEGNGVMTEAQGDTATIRLCDDTEDLETIALRGNWNDTLEILDAAHGLNFELQGGNTLKREGPTHTSNVGKLEASFKWDHAATTVDIIHSVAGDTRPIDAAGIVINNADTITVNSEGPAVTIGMLMGDSLNTVDLNADGDMTVEMKFDVDGDNSVDLIDATGVVGVFTGGVDGQYVPADDMGDMDPSNDVPASGGGDFTFLGGAGGAELTLCDVDDDAAGGVTIDGGTGGVNLTIEGTVDIDQSTLTNVGTVTLNDESTLRISMEDADTIGAENFLIDSGDMAMLHLVGLSDQEFALANYANGIEVQLVSIAALPEVTLNPLTDLSGVGSLEVPEGTTLNMTALQYAQLTGEGTITGIAADGTATTNYTVNITDWTQASVDYDEDGDGTVETTEHFDLSGITADNLTITMAEDIELAAADSLGTADVAIGDGMTLTLADIQQANGLDIGGGTGTTLKFTDISAGTVETIDASGFGVDTLLLPNTLVANRNVDLMFYELPEAVTKQIYTGLGFVEGVTQNVVIEEGVTVPGFLVFNRPEADYEIQIFNLTLEGGAHIAGNLRLSASDNEDDLLQMDLQEVNIVSTGTAENLLNGGTANIIGGVITPLAGPFPNIGGDNAYTSVDNDLLTVNISGDQVLEVGGIVFNSTVGNDAVTANDDDSAIATLNVNSSAAVVIGDLDTDSDNVDFLVVNNDGTGDLTIGISSLATVDAGDVITLNGSATGIDTAIVSGERDFSGDTIDADWDVIEFNNKDDGLDTASPTVPSVADGDVFITVTQQQFIDIGVGGFVAEGDGTAQDNDAILNLVAFDGSVPFDATGLDGDITIGTITMAPGVQTLDPSTNLTGVGKINVPEGGTLNLTAAQYQQIVGMGGLKICVVDGSDADTDIEAPITVNITGLTQADIDGGAFDLSMILTDAADDAATDPIGNVTVSLAESVELSDDDIVQTADGADAGTALESNVEFILTDGQDLGINNANQADGLEITGTGVTDVFFRFNDLPEDYRGDASITAGDSPDYFTQIDVSGYDVTQLHALNVFVGGLDVEYLLDDLNSDVTLVIYFDPLDLGILNETNRMVIIEPGTTVPEIGGVALAFNDLDQTDEVRTVMITALGGTVLMGDIVLDTTDDKDPVTAQKYLQSFTYMSEGDGTQVNADDGVTTANVIMGDITPYQFGAPASDNNLLDVNLIAENDLEITGTVFFNGEREQDDEASLDVSGSAPITIKSLDVESGQSGTDATIMTFNVNNTGTGTLTVTAGSDAIELSPNVMTLNFNGTGDIILDTDDGVGNNGIEGSGLKLIDASGHSGLLSLSAVEDVNSDGFAFVSGSGVNTLSMVADTLNDSNLDDMDPLNDGTGWSFDFTNAAAGSKLTLGPGLTIEDGAVLDIDMGPNGVLCINQNLDLTEVNLSYSGDQPIVLMDGLTLYLTAAQANGLEIVRGDDGNDGTDPAQVHIIDLGNDPVDLSGVAADLAGLILIDRGEDPENPGTFTDDITLDAATDLGEFTVALIPAPDPVDNDGTAAGADNFSPALGQTIRLATEEQADGLKLNVIDDLDLTFPATIDEWNDTTNPPVNEDTDAINSTNVVLLFNSVTGILDTSAIDPSLGRIWFSAELLNSVGGSPDQNLFNTLPATILRIDFNDVTELAILDNAAPVDRIVELTSFTTINNLTEVDDGIAPLEFIRTLTIDAGGQTDAGDILVGDVIAPPDENPATPVFTGLTFNSRVALSDSHYLATENYVNDNDGIDEALETQIPNAVNTVGDIGVGGTNPGIELMTVTINTFEDIEEVGDEILGAGIANSTDDNAGADFEFQTLTFNSDGTTAGALLTVTGENDATGKALDASDADITSVTIDTAGHSGSLVWTGGSPAFIGGDNDGDGNTETLTFTNGNDTAPGTAGEVWLGHVFDPNFDKNLDMDDDPFTNPQDVGAFVINVDGSGDAYAGIDASTLSNINTFTHGGTVNLGVVADIDSEVFRISNDNDGSDVDNAAGNGAGVGTVTLCLGEGLDADGNLVSPELSATGRWEFDNGDGSAGTMNLEMKAVTFNAGGQLELDGVTLTITGDIDMSALDPVDISIDNTTINVEAGATLTLTVEQVTALQFGGVIITGEGTVAVTGESDDTDAPIGAGPEIGTDGFDTDFANLKTATVNLSAVTLAATDGNQELDITATGALDGPMGNEITQTIIGSANNDTVTVDASADDNDDTTIDVITRLGADSGNIGVPGQTPTANTPDDMTPEVEGDVIIRDTGMNGQIQVEADAGFDTFRGDAAGPTTGSFDEAVKEGDVLQVSAGAALYVNGVFSSNGFGANGETSNAGTTVIEIDGLVAGEGIDLSAAMGPNGYIVIGANDGTTGDANTIVGSAFADTIIDGQADDGSNAGDIDTFTGNGGADTFVFGILKSDEVDYTVDNVQTGLDLERLEFAPGFDESTDGELVVRIQVENTTYDFTLFDGDPGVDLSTPAGTAAALRDYINTSVPGATASVGGAGDRFLTVVGSDENRVTIQRVRDADNNELIGGTVTLETLVDAGDHGDDPTDLADTFVPNDDRSEKLITFDEMGDLPVDGDVYEITLVLGNGATNVADLTFSTGALPTVGAGLPALGMTPTAAELVQRLADQMADLINNEIGGTSAVSANVTSATPGAGDELQTSLPAGTGQVILFDNSANNGGIKDIQIGFTASIEGLSSSDIIELGDDEITDINPDVIEDFMTGVDKIDFDDPDMPAGPGNYSEAAEVLTFSDALTAANVALGGGATYHLTSTAAEGGLLFYDANGDGTADGLIQLLGVDASTFAATDIA